MNELKIPKRNVTPNDVISSGEVVTLTENRHLFLNDGLGPRWMFWKRRRYLVVMLGFLGEVIKETLRVNLSVAVFAMTENHTSTDENGSTIYTHDFDWDVKTRGLILSVFYYGFVATHIIGGLLAVKYGGTRLYGLGVVITAISTLLTPTTAYISFYLLVALRIFEGMCEGILKPSMELILARWIPIEERSSLVAIVVTGNSAGVMFGMVVSSAILHCWGWSSIFYFTGVIGIAWYLAWLFMVQENPSMEKKISPSELIFIEYSLGKFPQHKTKLSSIPLFRISTSVALLALVCGCIPISSTYIMFSTQLPAYIKDVLRLDTQNSGYLSSLPFAAKVLTIYCISPVADYLTNRRILTTTAARKIYICGGLVIMAALCFLIQRATTTLGVLACLLAINMSAGAAFVQIMVNMLDLAPRYSSVLSGILYTIIAICGIFIPTMIGYLTQNKTAEEWHTVFSILAGVCLIGASIYGIFGSGKLQYWATEKDEVTA